MTERVKLTIKAANTLLQAVKWRRHCVEYQVMVPKHFIDRHGKPQTTWHYAWSRQRWQWDQPARIWPQDTYRDALLEIERLSDADKLTAKVFRITTERPA